MSGVTHIPALKAKVGNWNYYVCIMKYSQVAREFSFAHELGGNPELGDLLQRGIGERTKDIVDYLLKSEHRFLGSMIVAAWGGQPQYIPVHMEAPDDLNKGLDRDFGVLKFDGSQQYFALDGQHRLKAIKEAIKSDPEVGKDEISVILVSHYDTEDGKERTRRLFSNINKNAVKTNPSENIVLDEDDAFAIINRRIINENKFLKESGRVHIFGKQSSDGALSIAASVKDSDKTAITSIKQLYEIVKSLSFHTPISDHKGKLRPSEDELDLSFKVVNQRVDDFFEACGGLYSLAKNTEDLREFRKNKNSYKNEHAFLKGIVQRCVAEVLNEVVCQNLITWDECLNKLAKFDWSLGAAPWHCVVNENEGKRKMLTSRDFASLLKEILHAHLAPISKQQIKNARSNFNTIRGFRYPISEAELEVNLVQSDIS